jgi:O-antigen/teichoic acid export membrane protein
MGQTASSCFTIVAAFFGLRRRLGRAVKMEPYWGADWKPILRYARPVAIMTVAVSIQAAVETFVIRQRLPAIESAGYYIISRFGEMGASVGMTLLFVLFPLAAEKHEQGLDSFRLLWQAMAAALVSGLLLAVGFLAFGSWGLRLARSWRDYAAYAPQMALLTVIYSIRTAGGCFVYHQMACHRFGFVWYCSLASIIEAALLYSLTGYGFFSPYFPAAWVAWLASWQAARLTFVLATMFLFSLLPFFGMLAELLLLYRGRTPCLTKVA